MVELQTGQDADGRAGGDQDVIRFELLLAVFGLYLYLLGFDEAAYSVVDGDLVLLHQALHASPELVDDLFASLGRLRVVELYLADLDPKFFTVSGVVQEMGRLEQCFGRDAAYVQASASEMPALPLLDEGYAHPQLAGPDRRYVSPVPAADYYKVEVFRHLLAPFGRLGSSGLRMPPCRATTSVGQRLLLMPVAQNLMPLHSNSNCLSPPEPSSRWHAGQKCDGLPLTFSRTTSPSHPGQGCPCFSKTRR